MSQRAVQWPLSMFAKWPSKYDPRLPVPIIPYLIWSLGERALRIAGAEATTAAVAAPSRITSRRETSSWSSKQEPGNALRDGFARPMEWRLCVDEASLGCRAALDIGLLISVVEAVW